MTNAPQLFLMQAALPTADWRLLHQGLGMQDVSSAHLASLALLALMAARLP